MAAAVAVAFVLASLLVAVATPPYEANDENSHVLNVQTLVGGHWYRISDADSGFESHQAPLYYLTLALYQKALLRLPDVAPAPVLAAPGGPRIYEHATPGDGADQRRVVLLRLPSVALALVTLLLTYTAVRLLSSDPWTPTIAIALLCGNPRFAFLSGVVNNDNLANTLGAALLAASAVVLARGLAGPREQWCLGLALGGVFGLLVLTKITAAALAPAGIAALLVAHRCTRRARLRALAVAAGTAIVVSGWWFVQNQVRWGDPLASAATRDHLSAIFPPLFATGSFFEQAFDKTPRDVFRSFWYVSGWNQLYWRSALPYAVLWFGLGVGVAGLGWRRRSLIVPPGTLPVLWLTFAGGFFVVWYLGVETSTTSARVGFFALPAVGALYALGTERLRLPTAARLLVPLLGLVFTYVAISRDILAFAPN